MKVQQGEQLNLRDKVETFMRDNLQVNMDTRSVRRINDSMCVVELETWEKKVEVVKNKNKLISSET